MNRKYAWLMLLMATALLLLAACGPSMVTPTPKATVGKATQVVTQPTTPAVATAPATAVQPTVVPVDVSKLPVDPNDYHALGPADAAVTVIEYSDFQ